MQLKPFYLLPLFLSLSLHAQTFTLPRHELTPGLTRDLSLQQVCETKWGRDARHVTEEMKKQICAAYGANDCPGAAWELDHLVPRSEAGEDSSLNVWPQPIDEARKKDAAEAWVHRQVCAIQTPTGRYMENPKMPLADAQQQWKADFRVLYRLYLADRAAHKRPTAAPAPRAPTIPQGARDSVAVRR